MRRYAVRGAIGFGLTALLAFGLSAWHALSTGQPDSGYFLLAAPICGIIGGLAYGRRRGLPIVFGTCFALVELMFTLQDGRSPLLIDVVWTSLVTAFMFWIIGGSATLTLPAESRFDGARSFAIPGGVAGFAFQFMYGPAHSLFNLPDPWSHVVLWTIAGAGGGWLFGAELDRLQSAERKEIRKTSPWAVSSVAAGLFGLGIGALYFLRNGLPLGLFNSLSPASAASDWLWSWGVLGMVIGTIALIQTFRKEPRHPGRSWAVTGAALAVVLLFGSYRVLAGPWKTQFNTNYATKLISEHGHSGDREYGNVIYTGNLILAQAALDNSDITNAERYLLEAAAATDVPNIATTGPDLTIARALLDSGKKETVLEYLHRCHTIWPQGAAAINRWESAIRAGRRPNFNNRSLTPPEGGRTPG